MKKRLCLISFLLIAAILSAISAGAAQVNVTEVAASREIGVVAADYPVVGTELEPAAELPSSYSTVDLGYVEPIRNQNYNTCWAYSSAAVAEILLNQSNSGVGHLSTMHMNYWGTKHADGTGWQRSFTDAGYPYIAMGYMTSFSGFIPDDLFPDTTSFDAYASYAAQWERAGVTSLTYVDATDRDSIKTAIYENGAMVGNFHYDAGYLNGSTSAYCYNGDYLPTRSLIGHAVAIVGWDDNYSCNNFLSDHRPEQDGAWLCKNSWGANWSSMGGYFWISYEDVHLFDSRFGPSYTINDIDWYGAFDHLYQLETDGATYEFDYISEPFKKLENRNEITYVNVFDFSDGYPDLDSIVFESTSVGSAYEVNYIPLDENGVPDHNTETWTLLGDGVITYQGYLRVPVSGFELPAGRAGIGVTMKKTEQSSDLCIGVSEWLATGDKNIFLPQAKRGECYVIGYADHTLDLMDYYHDMLDDDIGGTFVIKALTSHESLAMGDVDGDGVMTILDVTMIQRDLADLVTLYDYQRVIGDYDGDNDLTVLDCTAIQRVLADIDPPRYT